MINKYDDFILERVINESLIYFTPPVLKLLDRLQDTNKIAEDLFNIVGEDVKPDVTYVGLADREGYFSFSTMRNVQRILSNYFPRNGFGPGEDNDVTTKQDNNLIKAIWDNDELRSDAPSEVFIKSRNPIKIGRLVNNLFPGKYTDKEVEDFVNKFKSAIEQSGERFIEVSGDEIGFYYSSANYKSITGTLGSSCMARHNSRIFQIYIDNPDVCSLLVLLDDNKVIGRALVWKLDTSDNKSDYFMDRQYTIKQSDVEKFKTYASEKGWSYKTNNNHQDLETVTYNDVAKSCDMTVQLKTKDYNYFPYLDTFRRYNPKNGILYNDYADDVDNIGCYILNSTDGGYEEVQDNVYSDWYDCDIPRDDAVYSRPLGDWLYSETAIRVDAGTDRRRGYYPEGYDDIVYSDKDEEYYHVDDTVYSDYNEDYYLSTRALGTVIGVNDDGEVVNNYNNWDKLEYFHINSDKVFKDFKNLEWYKKLSDKYTEWSDGVEAIYKGLLIKDYKDQYILEMFKCESYLIKTENEKEYFYLTKEDAKLFGYELELTEIDDIPNKRITDWFDYYKEIKSYENKPTLFRDTPFIELDKLIKFIDNEEEIELEGDSEYWEKRKWFIDEFIK